jgi:hypothetical protein
MLAKRSRSALRFVPPHEIQSIPANLPREIEVSDPKPNIIKLSKPKSTSCVIRIGRIKGKGGIKTSRRRAPIARQNPNQTPGGSMKKTLLALATVVVLAAAMLFTLNMPARAGAPPEKHPEIRAAIKHLEMAKDNLQKAAHDFGGHRVKALEHTNQALEECHKALESDEK